MSSNIFNPIEMNPENIEEKLISFEKEWKSSGVVVFYSKPTSHFIPLKENFLSNEEVIEFKGMSIESRKEEFLTSRWMIKSLLSLLLNKEPNKIIIKKSKLGKPYLSSDSSSFPLDFSISHKSSVSIVAITNKGQIGVDVEENIINEKSLRIAERYFHQKEIEWIKDSKSEEELNKRFYQLWSMKEAIVKTLGKGIFQNMSEFYLKALEQNFEIISNDLPWSQADKWKLFELNLPGNLIGSVSLFLK